MIIIIIVTKRSTTVCIMIITFAYYILQFGQIKFDKIHFISNSIKKLSLFKRKLRFINKRKENHLISLIDQHNQVAIEIHKMNLIRRVLVSLFVNFSIVKIISLYLLVNFNDFITKLFLIQSNLILLISGFGDSYSFMRQIKATHQPLKTAHSIVCKYKITNLQSKLKVIILLISY